MNKEKYNHDFIDRIKKEPKVTIYATSEKGQGIAIKIYELEYMETFDIPSEMFTKDTVISITYE